eukprot:1250_1
MMMIFINMIMRTMWRIMITHSRIQMTRNHCLSKEHNQRNHPKKRGPPKGCKQMGGRAKTTDYGGLAETMETIKAGNIEDIKKVAKKQICMAAASVLTMLNVKVNRKKMQKIIDKWEEGKDKKDITKAKTGTSAFYGAYDPSTASVSAGPVAIVRKAMTGTDALKVVQKVLGLAVDTEEKDENENKNKLSLPTLANEVP